MCDQPTLFGGGGGWRGVLVNSLVGCTIDSCFVLTLCGRSLPLCGAELSCSLLLDAVISSVHGQITVCSILSGGGLQDGEMAGGGERGQGWRRL